MPWTDYEIEELTRLWSGDLDAREIGATMNKSKNQIIGKAHRLGLPSRRDSPRRKAVETKSAIKRIMVARVPKKKKAPQITPVEGGIHIMDLEKHHCRGIVGYGPDGLARYCGADTQKKLKRWRGAPMVGPQGQDIFEDTSWCAGHAAVYFQK